MQKIIGHDKKKFNIGKWVAAKIYSDVKGNTCSCGGKFAYYQEIKRREKKSIFYPVCTDCKEPPPRFRIRAKLQDEKGQGRYVFVRKTLGGQYLEDPESVLDVFKRVEEDEKLGKFRHTEYDKKSVKEKDLFKNVVAAYIKFQEKRTDLTPYSLDSKKKYALMLSNGAEKRPDGTVKDNGFGEMSIHDIEGFHIEDFALTLESHSNRSMCLGTMKTILNWAAERYKLARVPKFEVPSSRKRKKVPDFDQAKRKIIPAIENEDHRMAIECLRRWGIRPSEVRAIQYEQIDLINDQIIIDRHFSKTTLLMGRKSAIEGSETGKITKKIFPELKEFIKSRPWQLDKKKFLFTNSVGKPLGVKDLSQTWRETLKKLKLPHVEMYGLRGAGVTKVIKEKGIHTGMKFAGHSDIKTTVRYDHTGDDYGDFLE